MAFMRVQKTPYMHIWPDSGQRHFTPSIVIEIALRVELSCQVVEQPSRPVEGLSRAMERKADFF